MQNSIIDFWKTLERWLCCCKIVCSFNDSSGEEKSPLIFRFKSFYLILSKEMGTKIRLLAVSEIENNFRESACVAHL